MFRLRLVGMITNEELTQLTREKSINLSGLACGCDGRMLFAVDNAANTVKEIDMELSQAINVHTCEEPSSPNDLISFVSNSTDMHRLAILTKYYIPQGFRVFVLEEAGNGMLYVKQSVQFTGASNTVLGRLAALQNVSIVVSVTGLKFVHVWTPGQQKSRELAIPQEKSQTYGMRVVRNSIQSEELLALTFLDDNSLDLFRIRANSLERVQSVPLTFKPSWLLWIAGRQTLLIKDNQHQDQVYSARMCEWTNMQKVNFCDEPLSIGCWCAWTEQNGVDSAVVVYDDNMKIMKKFAIQ